MTASGILARVLSPLLAVLLCLTCTSAAADIGYRYITLPKQDLPGEGDKITVIRSPLSGAPLIRPDGKRMRIEIDVDRVLEAPVEVWLKPSFGEARKRVNLTVENISHNVASRLWPGKTVHVVHVRLPDLDDEVTEDLYDLHVRWTRYWGFKVIQDYQPRAVKLVDNIPFAPRVAILADPQVGDPRALLEAAHDSWSEGNLNPLEYTWSEVIGNASPGDRWAAFQKTVEEINAQDPDFVLISGDLTFGAEYKYEFEDAYRLLNQIQAPTYITPGNHDGYKHPFMPDGQARWERHFGPLYYSVNVGSDIHITSINSYDWQDKHRLVTTWGGSVRDSQLNWLANDLQSWRANNPNGLLITFAHHDPSWEQSPGLLDSILDPQDQQWSGANRLSLRSLLNSAGVDVHFAGHTHSNRVARYIDDGSEHGKLVETLHGNCFRHATPHEGILNDVYDIAHCGEADPVTQYEHKQAILEPGNGTLFVETTTISSDTSAYWGWRLFPLERKSGYSLILNGARDGVDPSVMGYPMTDMALARIGDVQAVRGPGGMVNPDVADVGYYSHPSYFINVEKVTDTATRSEYRITNDSLVATHGSVIQSLDSCDTVSVSGGTRVWERTDRDNARTDVRTAYYAGPGQSVLVSASVAEGPSSCEEDTGGGWWPFW